MVYFILPFTIAKKLNKALRDAGDTTTPTTTEGVTAGEAISVGTGITTSSEDGLWEYGGDGWSNGGTSTGSLSTTNGMLDVNVSFNNTGWSQAAMVYQCGRLGRGK